MPQEIDVCQWCGRTVTIPEIANQDGNTGLYSHPNCHLVHVELHDWQSDVQRFHEKFGLNSATKPQAIDYDRMCLRWELHREEFEETQQALIDGNLVELADGICDLIYVLLGTAIESGIDVSPVWNEVQRTNMNKEGGAMREDGKILKPEGWEPPRVYDELCAQGMQG